MQPAAEDFCHSHAAGPSRALIGIAAGACLALLAALGVLLYVWHRLWGCPAPLACLSGSRGKSSGARPATLEELSPRAILPVGSRTLRVRASLRCGCTSGLAGALWCKEPDAIGDTLWW